MNQDDYWDCPCCGQPTPPEHDKECHCGIRVSHHLSVPTLCRRLREAQQRESSLIVRNKKLENEVNDQARLLGMSGERECDLRGELQRERALADRLAEAANVVIDQWETPNWKLTEPTATCMNTLRNTLAAWKEARS